MAHLRKKIKVRGTTSVLKKLASVSYVAYKTLKKAHEQCLSENNLSDNNLSDKKNKQANDQTEEKSTTARSETSKEDDALTSSEETRNEEQTHEAKLDSGQNSNIDTGAQPSEETAPTSDADQMTTTHIESSKTLDTEHVDPTIYEPLKELTQVTVGNSPTETLIGHLSAETICRVDVHAELVANAFFGEFDNDTFSLESNDNVNQVFMNKTTPVYASMGDLEAPSKQKHPETSNGQVCGRKASKQSSNRRSAKVSPEPSTLRHSTHEEENREISRTSEIMGQQTRQASPLYGTQIVGMQNHTEGIQELEFEMPQDRKSILNTPALNASGTKQTAHKRKQNEHKGSASAYSNGNIDTGSDADCSTTHGIDAGSASNERPKRVKFDNNVGIKDGQTHWVDSLKTEYLTKANETGIIKKIVQSMLYPKRELMKCICLMAHILKDGYKLPLSVEDLEDILVYYLGCGMYAICVRSLLALAYASMYNGKSIGAIDSSDRTESKNFPIDTLVRITKKVHREQKDIAKLLFARYLVRHVSIGRCDVEEMQTSEGAGVYFIKTLTSMLKGKAYRLSVCLAKKDDLKHLQFTLNNMYNKTDMRATFSQLDEQLESFLDTTKQLHVLNITNVQNDKSEASSSVSSLMDNVNYQSIDDVFKDTEKNPEGVFILLGVDNGEKHYWLKEEPNVNSNDGVPRYTMSVVTAQMFDEAIRQSQIQHFQLEYSYVHPSSCRMIIGIPVYRDGFINRKDRRDQLSRSTVGTAGHPSDIRSRTVIGGKTNPI